KSMISSFYKFLWKNNDKTLKEMILASIEIEKDKPRPFSIINKLQEVNNDLNWTISTKNKSSSILFTSLRKSNNLKRIKLKLSAKAIILNPNNKVKFNNANFKWDLR